GRKIVSACLDTKQLATKLGRKRLLRKLGILIWRNSIFKWSHRLLRCCRLNLTAFTKLGCQVNRWCGITRATQWTLLYLGIRQERRDERCHVINVRLWLLKRHVHEIKPVT